VLSITSISDVKAILKAHNQHPKKKWGQNFLIDKNVLNRIIQEGQINPHDYLVEVGPGLGVLTQQLALKGQGVLAIDIDLSLRELLAETLEGLSNVRVLFADVMKVNIEEEIKKQFALPVTPKYKVVANIPYYITNPIIFNLLENCPSMQEAILMVQREVAVRLLAAPGSKDYGLLTIMTSYYANIEQLMKISRNCFFPKPNVDSTLIKITPLPEKRVKVKDEAFFKHLVRHSFQKRRKTILNICDSMFPDEKNNIKTQLYQLNIDPRRRSETMSIQEFALLADAFYKQEA
jgi:16S rRNA (adenine1518-N6/adenine1519-N6)-dimethyltransferase